MAKMISGRVKHLAADRSRRQQADGHGGETITPDR